MTLKEMIIKLGLDHPKSPSKVTIRMIEGGGGMMYQLGPMSPGLIAHIEKEYESSRGRNEKGGTI